jgi:hypothetical protein
MLVATFYSFTRFVSFTSAGPVQWFPGSRIERLRAREQPRYMTQFVVFCRFFRKAA